MNIEQLISSKIRLPSPPATAVRILQAVQEDDGSMNDLARIISTDPVLTAKLLRLANSSIYSLSCRVATIDKALTVLGVNLIKNIALSFVIAEELGGESRGAFDIDYFWRRSVTAAVAGELISKLVGKPNQNAFVMALLLDIGVLVFYRHDPPGYLDILEERRSSGRRLREIEKDRFGFDHADLGVALLRVWGLPAEIVDPLLYHHRPLEATGKMQDWAEVMYLANRLSAVYHSVGGSGQVLQLHSLLTGRFGLSEPVIEMLVDEVAEKAREVFAGFDLEPGEMKPYAQMLEEANDELGRMNFGVEQLVLELRQAREQADHRVSELEQTNRQLRDQAVRDGLTGLYNRRYLQDVLDNEVERCRRYGENFSLILFDLDHFKKINDCYGHPVGDNILKQLARVVLEGVRKCDSVARYGGEEFAVILPNTDAGGLQVFAERLRRQVELHDFEAGGLTVQLTISLGGATFVGRVSKGGRQELIEAADRALYQSKAEGRNRVAIRPVRDNP